VEGFGVAQHFQIRGETESQFVEDFWNVRVLHRQGSLLRLCLPQEELPLSSLQKTIQTLGKNQAEAVLPLEI